MLVLETLQLPRCICLYKNYTPSVCTYVHVSVTQSCPTLCDPMDYSPPGSSVHGILQARILEWVAMSPPGDLPDPGIEPLSPALQVDSLSPSHLGVPLLPANRMPGWECPVAVGLKDQELERDSEAGVRSAFSQSPSIARFPSSFPSLVLASPAGSAFFDYCCFHSTFPPKSSVGI